MIRLLHATCPGAGWADPDSGFTIAHESIINHTNASEIYGFHLGGAQFCYTDGSTGISTARWTPSLA